MSTYILAVTNEAPDGLSAAIAGDLIRRGLPVVTRLDGVDAEKMRAFRPDRRIGLGTHWALYREPPFGTEVEPEPAVVVEWVRASLLRHAPQLSMQEGPGPDPGAQRH